MASGDRLGSVTQAVEGASIDEPRIAVRWASKAQTALDGRSGGRTSRSLVVAGAALGQEIHPSVATKPLGQVYSGPSQFLGKKGN